VKIMLSYDYSHFEVALSSDDELDAKGVNALRKKAQRLADEAVRQYKQAKLIAEKRSQAAGEKRYFLQQVSDIEAKPEGDRTVREMAILKQHDDENWEAQFEWEYDYEDDADFDEEPTV
jgi:hypothetical protein